MNKGRWNQAFLLCVGGAFLSACNISFSVDVGARAGIGESLPEPDMIRKDPPALNADQQARQEEADAYVLAQYGNAPILQATQGYSGDIYDWLEPSALGLSTEAPLLPWLPEDLILPEGIEFGLGELEQFPELLGPPETMPMLRPDFSAYVMGGSGATSLQEHLDHHQVPAIPAGANRLYAGMFSVGANFGVTAYINTFEGEVEDNTFSVAEIAVSCPAEGPVQEMIGVMISIDRVNFKEDAPMPRMHVEYARMVNGELKGTYDRMGPGFVPYKHRRKVPGGFVEVSVPGGRQVERWVSIFQVAGGDWWLAVDGYLLGHYPASLFTMLNKQGCVAHYYGENYDGTPEDWTPTDMGSGYHASAGLSYAAYIRQPKVLNSLWVPSDPIEAQDAQPYRKECYSRSLLLSDMLLWGLYFFFGGPGGGSPGCE